MRSNEEICRLLPGNPAYIRLKALRRGVAFSFAAICLGLCAVFMLTAVLAPSALTVPLNAQGTLTSGLLGAIGLILLSWILTGVYIHLANTRFDPLCEGLLEEVRA